MRKYLSHSLDHRKEYTELDSELISGLFKNYVLLPYFFQYKYWNLIDVETNNNYTFFLASDSVLTKVNGLPTRPNKPVFGIFDFGNNVMKLDYPQIKQREKFLKVDDFEFEVDEINKNVRFTFKNRTINFQEVILDSTKADVFGLYGSYTLKMRSDHLYMMAQNVVVRGPLTPWIWLDFYLNDGTYLNLFHILERTPYIRVNNEIIKVNKFDITEESLNINAEEHDKFLNLEIALDHKFTTTVKPFLMPLWEYNQFRATLKKIDSNIIRVNDKTKGCGQAERTKGLTLV